ncbi:MAG: DnaD domain protein [Bacillales bacterium]|nr:DnaD domain protein [Bacillales bacterium]
MKNFKINQIDYRYVLVDTYKSLNLNEYDLAVLLVIDNILREEPVLVTAELLALKMNIDVKELDNILVSLVNRGFLEYVSISNNSLSLVTSLRPTYNRLQENFVRGIVTSVHLEDSRVKKEEISNIFASFEREMKRTLTPIELEKIREWVSQGIKEEMIIDCLREVMSKSKRVSLRAVDRAIIKRMTSNDREKEGYSAINDKWKQDIENTIDIANTKWTDE